MTPEEAAERYLKEREPDVSKSTLYNHRSLLRQWWRWCNDNNITDVQDLDGFDIADFRLHRRGEVGEVTLYNQMSVLRVFVRWLQSRQLVDAGLADGMLIDQPDDVTRNTMIKPDTAHTILEYLETYEYATLRHVAFVVFWHTGMRLGALHSLDVTDYHPEKHYIELCHRPDQDTPLKNGDSSEREVNVSVWVCEIIDNYIAQHREKSRDGFDREPLLTTTHGRASHSNIREHITQLTRPCHHTNNCPHDREQSECEATERIYAARCPSSVSPHDLRRSAVTYLLDQGHRKELVADRVDMSVKTLDKHYDKRTESEKRELRRKEFDMR